MSHTYHTPVPIIAIGLFTSFLIAACSGPTDRFHLEGQFNNISQGEFYIYSPEQGYKDTIAVNDGRFSYVRVMKDTVTLVLLFPNYSEMPIFAEPGAEVKMEGDVSHLKETRVSGTDDNDAMTDFRASIADKTPPEVQQAARQYIHEHPDSPVSSYLLRRYFLQASEVDYPEALKLCATLRKAQPQNQPLARLHILLETMKNNRSEGSLPAFRAVSTKGDSVSNHNLRSEVNVVALWATWNYDSHELLQQLHKLVLKHPDSISVVSISLDASPSEGKNFLEHDSIPWPNICDGQLWQSPLITQLGMAVLPTAIITDKDGTIIARDLPNSKLIDKLKELLGDKRAKKSSKDKNTRNSGSKDSRGKKKRRNHETE